MHTHCIYIYTYLYIYCYTCYICMHMRILYIIYIICSLCIWGISSQRSSLSEGEAGWRWISNGPGVASWSAYPRSRSDMAGSRRSVVSASCATTVTPLHSVLPKKACNLSRTQHNSVSASNHVRTRIATTLGAYVYIYIYYSIIIISSSIIIIYLYI